MPRAPSPAIREALCAMTHARRRPPCPARPHPARQPGRQAPEELCRRGDAGREEGGPHRQDASAERRDQAAVRPSAAAGGRRCLCRSRSTSPARRDRRRGSSATRASASARRRSPKHIAYLKREGVTRDGADARMFDATLGRRRRRRLSPSAARTTGIISGSSSRRKTRPRWPTFKPSRAS